MGNQPVQRLVFSHRDNAIEEADIQRMKTCLQDAGYDASEADIAAAWLYYSEGFAATWLMPPESDQEHKGPQKVGQQRPCACSTK
ncbi:hypothetical protein [Cupriavidus alkaliphilus]|uniref:hypothetical protein n=1 Tax=Cupriavidus alkaliphilus TaxID=942866 RepID=UPI00339D6D6F